MNSLLQTRKQLIFLIMIVSLSLSTFVVSAQNEFAAVLEVLASGVEVQRVNTANAIPVSVEAIVGVGDIIRTDETGEARITFFADGTDVTIEPESEYRIIEFEGDDEDFQLTVEVIVGQTVHRLGRTLGTDSAYEIDTPGMTLSARGTEFAIRVEDNGRSAMLVTEGDVDANTDESEANIPVEFGVRSEMGQPLSDVVRASSFEELDAGLDGCTVSVTTTDDVSLNVRLGPDLAQARIGTIAAEDITEFFGVNEGGTWYRIEFQGNFAWVLSSTATIGNGCAGLRTFPDSQVEDINLYNDLGDSVDVDNLDTPDPEATEEPTTDE